MHSSEKSIITVDFDGITSWPVNDEAEQDEHCYSVDM